jgi:hypothetical protein
MFTGRLLELADPRNSQFDPSQFDPIRRLGAFVGRKSLIDRL